MRPAFWLVLRARVFWRKGEPVPQCLHDAFMKAGLDLDAQAAQFDKHNKE